MSLTDAAAPLDQSAINETPVNGMAMAGSAAPVVAPTAAIRVMLVDDHRIMREGLRALLRSANDITVVGEAANGPEAVALLPQLSPDVVVMDLSMPGGGGSDATRIISASKNAPKVLILTMHEEAEYLVPLLELGARGFLTKDAAEQELELAIRTVAAGEVYVRAKVARLLAARIGAFSAEDAEQELRSKFQGLSAREREVLRLVAQGFNGPEIGRTLNITSKSVDTYKARIEKKTGIKHRSDYVKFATAVSRLAGFNSES
ncbi:MAG: response regulator transcription factor [Gemmatimonadaceae bacterium]